MSEFTMENFRAMEEEVRQAYNKGLEDAAKMAEGSEFLHDGSPKVYYGRQIATAIRELKR